MSEDDKELILVREIEELAHCRICLERGDPDDYMCLPCNCAGSIKYIHPDCLKEWIKSSGTVECEICHSLYKRRWTMWAYENNLIRSPNEPTQNDMVEEDVQQANWKVVLASLLLCTMFTVILILAAGSHMLSEDAADYLGVSFRVMVVILAFGGVIITVVIRRRLGLSILQESMV